MVPIKELRKILFNHNTNAAYLSNVLILTLQIYSPQGINPDITGKVLEVIFSEPLPIENNKVKKTNLQIVRTCNENGQITLS